VLQFKKSKAGYEDGKRGASLRYSLDIESFLRGEGRGPPESSAAHAAQVETSLNAPSSDVAPLTSGLLPTALDAGQLVLHMLQLGRPLRILHPTMLRPDN